MEGKKRKEGIEEYRREQEDSKRWEKKIGKEKRKGEREKKRKTKKSRTSQILRIFRSIKENFPTILELFHIVKMTSKNFLIRCFHMALICK